MNPVAVAVRTVPAAAEPAVELLDPRHLRLDDVIELPAGAAQVIAEPELGQSGSSIFDAYELYWLVGVRMLADETHTGYATFPTDGRVRVRTSGRLDA